MTKYSVTTWDMCDNTREHTVQATSESHARNIAIGRHEREHGGDTIFATDAERER